MNVNGLPLRCPHCGGESFEHSELPFVNQGLSIFGLNLGDDGVVVFCCRGCGRFELFRHARITRSDPRGEAGDCSRCGMLIPATEAVCPNCSEPK